MLKIKIVLGSSYLTRLLLCHVYSDKTKFKYKQATTV